MGTQTVKSQPAAKHSNSQLTISSRHELPIIQQGQSLLVDGQILYARLKSRGRYRDWIYYRIREYGFKEGEDYFAEKVRKTPAGRPEVNYHLTIDMAKELAMLERNEEGRQIRRYFIRKEKEARIPTINFKPLEGFTMENFTKGMKPFRINNCNLFPFREVCRRLGYSDRASAASRKKNYGQHFMKVGEVLYITEEYAHHMAHSRACYVNRERLKQAQPVLPFNFGDPSGLLGQEGGSI